MDWRNKKDSESKTPQHLKDGNVVNKVYKHKNEKNKLQNNSEEKKQFSKHNNQKELSNKIFDNNKFKDNHQQGKNRDNKNVFRKNNDYKSKQKTYYKSHEEIDKVLSSGKYISANKRTQLELIREKLKKEYDEKHPDINNELMFPSLSNLIVQVQPPKTCWGQKLPSQIYDTSIQFQKNKQLPKNITNVNSDISDENDYDSFDDDDDYYNEDDEDYDEEGF